MKLLKYLFVCFLLVISNTLLLEAQDEAEDIEDCLWIPELFITEITSESVVHYIWTLDGTASFYALEYRGMDSCIDLEDFLEGFTLGTGDTSNVETHTDSSEPSSGNDITDVDDAGIITITCPPDVWIEVPGPTLKTSTNATNSKTQSGIGIASFPPCLNFEFRLKVICNSDTLISNPLPFFYDDGSCPDCMPERILRIDHETDMVVKAENRLSSFAKVSANVTYKAGERIVLKSGFSTTLGFNFKVMTESCSEP